MPRGTWWTFLHVCIGERAGLACGLCCHGVACPESGNAPREFAGSENDRPCIVGLRVRENL